jgi:ketosteroid isomerase-like protein
MHPNEIEVVADELFEAIVAGDIDRVRAIYADDVEVWVNATQKTQTRDENIRLLRYFKTHVSDLRYEVHQREFFPGGLVQRHTLHGKLASGDLLAVPVCILIHIADGKIKQIFEYLDSVAVAPVFAR